MRGRVWYNGRMKIDAYAKINLILNVLGTRPDGYHEVEMLMQAVSFCDAVTVKTADALNEADRCGSDALLGPQHFEYGQKDLAYKAALLMAETFRPELVTTALDENGLELVPGVKGVHIEIEKRIPAAAGLAGGSSDTAAVITGLGRLWLQGKNADDTHEYCSNEAAETFTDELLEKLLPLGAGLGSDVPFCVAAQLGHPAAIARGRGTDLEFVKPVDCGVDLYFSDFTIPNKTAAVYAELKEEDCAERFSIEGFLNASSLEEKKRLTGNHLQAPAERLFGKIKQLNCSCTKDGAVNRPSAGSATPAGAADKGPGRPESATLCGAGPTYFTLSETGRYRTIVK